MLIYFSHYRQAFRFLTKSQLCFHIYYLQHKVLFLTKVINIYNIYQVKQSTQAQQNMKKKDQINIHKNLQSGKTYGALAKPNDVNPPSHRNINDKNSERASKKVLSQQKVYHQKRSESKTSNKDNKGIKSSTKRLKSKQSKEKVQSVKSSKKSLKRHYSIDQNSNKGYKNHNIYTNISKKQKAKNKVNKYTDRSSQSSNNDPRQENSLTSIATSIKSQSQRMQVQQLVKQITQQQFSNLHKLKLHMLDFIFKNRIIRDEQYDKLFELLAQKFPDKEDLVKSVLFQIVSSLDN